MLYFRLSDCSILDETLYFQYTTQLLNLITFLGIFPSFCKWGKWSQELKMCRLGPSSTGQYIYMPASDFPPMVCVPWLYCSSGHSLLSDLYLSRGIHWLSSHLTCRTLSSFCNVLESSCVRFATLVSPSSANPSLCRRGKRKTRMGTQS